MVEFKESSTEIARNCSLISESLLVNIKKKKVFGSRAFAEKQESHRADVKAKLTQAHHQILEIMNKVCTVAVLPRCCVAAFAALLLLLCCCVAVLLLMLCYRHTLCSKKTQQMFKASGQPM